MLKTGFEIILSASYHLHQKKIWKRSLKKREKTDQWNNPIIRISFQKWIELFLDVDFYKGDDDGVTE